MGGVVFSKVFSSGTKWVRITFKVSCLVDSCVVVRLLRERIQITHGLWVRILHTSQQKQYRGERHLEVISYIYFNGKT